MKLTENDVTPYELFKNRRKIIQGIGASSIAGFMPNLGNAQIDETTATDNSPELSFTKNENYVVDEASNSFEEISSYNNFYEFSLDKKAPARLAQNLVTSPWTLTIDGECENPMVIDVEDLIKKHTVEQRIYRFRCVEAWSMVIPWLGISLADIIKEAKPTSKAKHVAFETLHDPEQMPEQQPSLFGSNIEWPYREGLRIDEAVNPLSLLSVGLYDKLLPNQNGAPIRLVVPWKYGFKSIKSIVKITFTEQQPYATWNALAPHEYGYYANVNPNVSHPRWSQARERRVGEIFKRPTLMFNGYENEVADMYKDMDLNKFI